VVPEVEAPEGSGLDCWTFGGGICFGLVPELDGVGDDRGLLVAGKALVSEPGGEAGRSNRLVGWIQRLQSGHCCPIVLSSSPVKNH